MTPQTNTGAADGRIAIIGLGGLFPGARNVHEYWTNIVHGVDCLTEVPETHWRIEDYYDPDPTAPDKTYARRGGFVPTIDFDPLYYGLPPTTLGVTGVLQLLSLVVARQTLADAGTASASWYDPSRTGVILGVTGSNSLTQPLSARLQTPVLKEVVRSCGLTETDAEEIAAKFTAAFAPWEENSFPGMLGNVVAGRIANRFDLGATNCTVDAACASSLAALRMAVAELASGRADLMLSGGCDAENTILMYLCFSKTPALSRRERVRPFDEEADGTLIGEGLGMLALKRLADAERDGDRIYAVLDAVGSSSDGRYTSIYAPRASGQVVALRRAYQEAGFGPEQVGLLECHGTGTVVGDLTELTALRQVFEEAGAPAGATAIGSVKSQIGHTKAAAGAASLIKVALALHQRVLPPTINVDTPRRDADLDSSPFHVNTRARPWLTTPYHPRRRAGVSAFGFGGTNFHCLLEEHRDDVDTNDPRLAAPVLHRAYQVHGWHAPTVTELLLGLDVPGAPPELTEPVPDEHPRITAVARDEAELETLRQLALSTLRRDPEVGGFELPEGIWFAARARPARRTAALFAGQGSQYVGMGRTAVLALPPLRAAFDEAERHAAGLGAAVFPPPAFDQDDEARQETALRATDRAQPAIGALSLGQYRYVRELGFRPDTALGHSFGELTALWSAGSLSDEDFLRLAVARGRAMTAAGTHRDAQEESSEERHEPAGDPGAMAAVGCGADRLTTLLAGHDDVVLCNDNAPDQVVVGGGTDSVRRFVDACRAEGVGARVLPVAAAFHTPRMRAAEPAFASAVADVDLTTPAFPVRSTTLGAEYGSDPLRDARILVDQLTGPVSFGPRVEELHEEGVRVFVEFGPGRVLSGLVRRLLTGRADVEVLTCDPGPHGDADRSLKQLVARLIVLGHPLTHPNRHAAAPPRDEEKPKMSIPMNGANHVPADRRERYRQALREGYRIPEAAAPAGGPTTPEDVPPRLAAPDEPHVPTRPGPAGASPAPRPLGGDGALTELAARHLALHDDYLTSQLRVAEQLAGLLHAHGRGETPPDVLAGIGAVTDTALAIGRSHVRASETLRALAELGAVPGGALPPTSGDRAVLVPAPAPGPAVGEPGETGGTGGGSGDVVPLSPARASTPDTAPVAQPITAEPVVVGAGEVSVVPSRDEVRRVLVEVVAERTGYPVEMVDPSMDVEADLGVDSIKRVEVVGALRERWPGLGGVGLEELGESRTLDDLVDVLVPDHAPDPVPESVGIAPPAPAEEVVADPKGEGGPAVGRRWARPVELPPPDVAVDAYRATPTALLAGALTEDHARCFAEALTSEGWTIGEEDTDDGTPLDLVVYLAPRPADLSDARDALLAGLMLAARNLGRLAGRPDGHRTTFLCVTRTDGQLGYTGTDLAGAALGGLAGLVRTAALEHPALFARIVDLDARLAPERAARLLVRELRDAETDLHDVGWDAAGVRRTIGLTDQEERQGPLPLPAGTAGQEPGAEDLLVVTGGGRGITAACAVGLARAHQPGLILLGRSRLEPDPPWAVGVEDIDLRTAAARALAASGGRPTPPEVERERRRVLAGREIRRTLSDAEAAGSHAEYVAVDITDPVATARALEPYQRRVTGVVHGAGVLADRRLVDKRASEMTEVLDVKITGLRNVLDALDTDHLRHLLLFSSVAGLFGNPGQADYATANEALNRLACAVRRHRPATTVQSVNWGAWEGGMVTPEVARLFTARGVPLIPEDTGVARFVEQFRPDRASDLVCAVGPDMPLAPITPVRAPTTTVERSLRPLVDEPVVSDHRIGGAVVLPVTFALGLVLNVARRLRPELPVRQVTDFTVLSGVRWADDDPPALRATATGTADGLQVLVSTPDGRPRYRALLPTPPERPALPARLSGLPTPGSGRGAAEHYSDGTLFHGPELRGLRRVLTEDPRLVLECQLTDVPVAARSYHAANYSPVLADLLLQAALLRARLATGLPALPTGIGTVELHGPLPDDTPFLVVVDGMTGGGNPRCTVSAVTPAGGLLLRFTDVLVVPHAGLQDQFASS
ncbi:type I polyketide synthase [Actinoalloteichus caeruleus]|uniref:type I polyketide synthase n=1 Tax=Actinoalloteichus cyanogriseus TaxID=2893586 RepID=UPI0005BAEF65|nr:type I polyketide synthase [Actinoalloteichus caeruleus]